MNKGNSYRLIKSPFLALLITFFIISIFGLPFSEWWFTGDDFHGVFLGYKTKTWEDLFYFFYEGNTNQGTGVPGGYVEGRPSFLGAYYRPLYCIYLALQYWCFGTQGYGYFLCNIIMHALAAGLLFYLFSKFTSRWTAALGALLFAFHPQIAYRFGAIVNFHYYVNVALVLGIALLLMNYLETQKLKFLGTALFLYVLSLGTRETTLVLPAIIGVLVATKNYIETKKIDWKLLIQLTFLFGFFAVAFLAWRLWLYPLAQAKPNGAFLPYAVTGNFAAVKLQEFLIFFYDLFFVSWLPWGNKLLKILVLFPMLALSAYTWWRCRKKILVIALFISGILMLWPGLISFYSPRYFYEGAPFFLAAFIALFVTSPLSRELKQALKIGISLCLIGLGYFTFISFQARELKLKTMHDAVTSIYQQLKPFNKPLCLLTSPSDGAGYIPQIFWILFNNRDYPIYGDPRLAVTQQDSNIVKPTRWFNAIAPYYKKNYLQVSPVEKDFIIRSLDEKKVAFENYEIAPRIKIGELQCLAKRSDGMATILRLRLDPALIKQDPFFIYWDYEKERFQIINYQGGK